MSVSWIEDEKNERKKTEGNATHDGNDHESSQPKNLPSRRSNQLLSFPLPFLFPTITLSLPPSRQLQIERNLEQGGVSRAVEKKEGYGSDETAEDLICWTEGEEGPDS